MAHRAPIIISPYNPLWARQYQAERERILQVVPPYFVIEHIGSTSVFGMPAKPIIDLMLGADSLRAVEEIIPQLHTLGYEYLPQHEAELPQRRFLAKPFTRPRQFHLHGAVINQTFWNEHLRFRDVLRTNKQIATDYAKLKIKLADAYGDDRAGYTAAKTEFIQSVIALN